MNSEDFKFKKECQATHKKVCGLLSKNDTEEAGALIAQIEKRAKEWEDYERSIQLRSRLMRQLLSDLSSKQRIKVARLRRKREV